MNKPLPQDIGAERIILASILKNNDAMGNLMDLVGPNDFYTTKHSLMYLTMIEMFNKDIPIEIESLCSYLGKDKLMSIGGITYIAELISTELTSNVNHYAAIVKEKSNKRNLIKSCQEALEQAYREADHSLSIVDKLESQFLKFNDLEKEKTNNMNEIMALVLDQIEKRYQLNGEIPGIKTGLTSLDKATNGYQKGDLWVIAARPSMGKTLLSLNLLAKLPKEYNGLMFELEMTKEKLGNRMLAAESKIQSKILSRGKLNDEEFEKVSFSCNKITSKNNIFINCKANIGLGYIRSEAKKIKIKHGLDVIFIDHLGLLKSSDKGGNRNLELGELTTGLKAIAKDLDVCVVSLCQLSRAVEQRKDKHPILSDLRESGHIEEDSDTVIMLYRDDYYAERERRESENPNSLELFIAKNRDGEVGGIEFYCNLENQLIAEKDFRN